MMTSPFLMEWHDEATRFEVWGTLDPTHSCMCTSCVLGEPCGNIGEVKR